MCLSDTAEYWADAKRSKGYFGSTSFVHIPNAECGHRHHSDAKRLGDVTCYACLKLIKNGYEHNLPEGKTVSKAERKRRQKQSEQENIRRAIEEKHGKCRCGKAWVIRKNKSTSTEFLGCSNYPKCKNTKSIT